jgi:hypothetical protein
VSALGKLRGVAALLPVAPKVEFANGGLSRLIYPDGRVHTAKAVALLATCLGDLEVRKTSARDALARAEAAGDLVAYKAAFEEVVRADCTLREARRIAEEGGTS